MTHTVKDSHYSNIVKRNFAKFCQKFSFENILHTGFETILGQKCFFETKHVRMGSSFKFKLDFELLFGLKSLNFELEHIPTSICYVKTQRGKYKNTRVTTQNTPNDTHRVKKHDTKNNTQNT